MKLRHLIGILVLTAALLSFAPAALAEEVRITVSTDPVELAEADTVELSFSVSNFSDYELHNVEISTGGERFDLGYGDTPLVIPMGGSATDIRISFAVADAQIGLDIPFTVSWVQGGEPMSQQVSVRIARAADPVIALSRTVDTGMARQGETVTLFYTLQNDTKFDMTDITIMDEQISDSPVAVLDALHAETTQTLEYRYTMIDSDVVSAPVVTYSINGKTKTFSAVEPLPLRVMLVKLSLAVSVGTPTQAGVLFSLDIKNDGNQAVSDIQIVDDESNAVNPSRFSLEAGESTLLEYLVIPRLDIPVRSVAFTVDGTDPFGNLYTLQPQRKYEVYPFVDESQIQTALRADIIDAWTAESGSIKVRITLVNYSEVALSNVQISELSLGLLSQLETLSSGENVIEQIIPLGSPRNLSFAAKGIDPTGAIRALGECTLAVAYDAAPGATAVPTPAPETNAEKTVHSIAAAISKILIVLGVIMTLAFVAMVVLSIMERSRTVRLADKKDVLDDDDFEDGDFLSLELLDDPTLSGKESLKLPAEPLLSDWPDRRGASDAPGSFNAQNAPDAIRPAKQPLAQIVEVEYDGTFADLPDAAAYAPAEPQAAQPQRTAGPKTLHRTNEPLAQPKHRRTVRHVGGESERERNGV